MAGNAPPPHWRYAPSLGKVSKNTGTFYHNRIFLRLSNKARKKMLIAKSLCWENSNIQTSELRYSLGRELSLPPPRRSWDSTLRHKLFSNQNCPFCQDLGGVIRTTKLLFNNGSFTASCVCKVALDSEVDVNPTARTSTYTDASLT